MSQAIRVVLQQPGQQPRSALVPLEGGKIHIGTVKQEFGLRTLKKVTQTEPEGLLMYEDAQGWSIATFMAGETVTVCGTPVAGVFAHHMRPVSAAEKTSCRVAASVKANNGIICQRTAQKEPVGAL